MAKKDVLFLGKGGWGKRSKALNGKEVIVKSRSNMNLAVIGYCLRNHLPPPACIWQHPQINEPSIEPPPYLFYTPNPNIVPHPIITCAEIPKEKGEKTFLWLFE